MDPFALEIMYGPFLCKYIDNPKEISYSPDQLEIVAKNLELTIDDSLEQTWRQGIPSFEWLATNFKHTLSLDPQTQKTIGLYGGSGYMKMNGELREGKGIAHLNPVIRTYPPLEHSIRVLRFVETSFALTLPKSGPFLSFGYLSTSFDYYWSLKDSVETSWYSMLDITVPKGAHAIHLPSDQVELVFSSGVTLNVKNFYKKLVKIKGKKRVVDWYEMDLIEGS